MLKKSTGNHRQKSYKKALVLLYVFFFLLGLKALFHGLPDIERFFAEWFDEKMTLTSIMKFGTLNFTPTLKMHPPLYHYLTFIPVAIFFIVGKLIGLFHDKTEFLNFYFNQTQYFFLIGRAMSYIFFWSTAIVIYKMCRLFYGRIASHMAALSYLLIPGSIMHYSTTRPETLLFLTTSIFLYFFLRYYLETGSKYLYLAGFFLGVATATKYNAIFLGFIFVLWMIFRLIESPKEYKKTLQEVFKTGFFIFFGFFVCDPIFVIDFNKHFYNLQVFTNIEAKYYWTDYYPVVFCVTHLKSLMSSFYINIFGLVILISGGWSLLKKDKRLYFILFSVVFFLEVYFGIFQKNASPLRYINPLLPIAVFIFGAGVDFIIREKRKLIAVLVFFGIVLIYNYFDVWHGFSFGPTYLQEARSFIEKTIPGYTSICITSNNYVPQLSMTRSSYQHLMDTASKLEDIAGHVVSYKKLEGDYNPLFKEIRIQSLLKDPQYNIVRWDESIKTEKDAVYFLRNNNIKYMMGSSMPFIEGKSILDTGIVSLVRTFEPKNKRVYDENRALYLVKVKETL